MNNKKDKELLNVLYGKFESVTSKKVRELKERMDEKKRLLKNNLIVCKKCLETKIVACYDYQNPKYDKTKLRLRCKECRKQANKEYFKKNFKSVKKTKEIVIVESETKPQEILETKRIATRKGTKRKSSLIK